MVNVYSEWQRKENFWATTVSIEMVCISDFTGKGHILGGWGHTRIYSRQRHAKAKEAHQIFQIQRMLQLEG